MQKGKLYVVSAPSGCGKGTILELVFARENKLFYSVSATTRAPRTGERDGVNYYFLTREQFQEKIAAGQMLEYAEFCGNFYGTPRGPVEEKLESGVDVILEIETQGAMQVKKSMPEAVLIFILPPSMQELRRRLNKRGTEPLDVIEKRLGAAEREISRATGYDYILVNAGLEDAVEDFCAVLRASKLTGNDAALRAKAILEEQETQAGS